MRLALLSDVHANLEALEAVLADVDGWRADALVCAGDLVGYGPDPEVCIERLRGRGALCIAGNHEGMVLGTLGFERCAHVGIRAALWTRGRLSNDARAFLAALPATLRIGDVAICHGSLDDPEHYLASPVRADAALAALARREPDAGLLVAGHTHHQALYRAGAPWRPPPRGTWIELEATSRWLVNPGSVGQSRDRSPLARYARYDTTARAVEFRELEYAHDVTVAKLARAGLAARVCLLPKAGLAARIDGVRTRWARLRAPPVRRPAS
jgi:diadenosine tetraphosphatase ApaH/serine/threonine PP2A family protein phosphatase